MNVQQNVEKGVKNEWKSMHYTRILRNWILLLLIHAIVNQISVTQIPVIQKQVVHERVHSELIYGDF